MSTAPFPEVTFAKWRALVEKDLAGKPFDRTLVHEALAGVSIAPLYASAPPVDASARLVRTEPFRVCMRHHAGADVADLVADVTGGADALWLPFATASKDVLAREELARTSFLLETTEVPSPELATGTARHLPPTARLALAVDPMAWRARGRASFATLRADLEALGRLAVAMRARGHLAPVAFVSTEPYHDAGADAVDEIAMALATGAAYLEALVDAGLTLDEAATAIALRTTAGRDTFAELCKLRALRVCFDKMLVASGASPDAATLVHAVCSSQTMTVRDPWVNMLRVTTQIFAAVVGGADLVTPNAFDQAFGAESGLGRRLARNTGLVLREESALGKVSDPAGGSYYFDSLTDVLARQAWARFQDVSRSGGVAKQLESGELTRRLEAAWSQRFDRIAKRKVPILGVSEFANLGETLPHPVPHGGEPSTGPGALPVHRDAAAFEELRTRADAMAERPEALLLTLGTFAESRPRAGFAASFFSAGGIESREVSAVERAAVVCLCGTDERYAEEAAARVAALKALGTRCVLLAGRPGPLAGDLEKAGIDGFLFVGCDALSVLAGILDRITVPARDEARR